MNSALHALRAAVSLRWSTDFQVRVFPPNTPGLQSRDIVFFHYARVFQTHVIVF